MARKMKMAYWLLPAAALCVAAMGMAITPSYARYENTVAWYTVATPEKAEVTSQFLGKKAENLMILTGEMPEQGRTISLSLRSNADTAQPLQWTVDKPDYMDVAVQLASTQLTSGDSVLVNANTPAQLSITVTPTEKAAQPHPKLTALLQVSYGEDLAGTFWVELPAVENTQQIPIQEIDTVEEKSAVTTQNTDPVEVIAEIQPGQTETEQTPPSQTEPEQTIPEAATQVTLNAPASWHPSLPVPLTVTAQTDTLVAFQLLMQDGMQDLPAATRFSFDNGKTWFALYASGRAELPVTAGQPRTVLLDMRHTAVKELQTLTFAHTDGAKATVQMSADGLYAFPTKVLTQSGSIVLTMPALWQEASFVYSIDMLTADETGTAYQPVSFGEDALQADFAQTEQGYALKLFIGEKLPPAGTYRLNLRWQAGETLLKETQEYFFIHYSTTPGGERQ